MTLAEQKRVSIIIDQTRFIRTRPASVLPRCRPAQSQRQDFNRRTNSQKQSTPKFWIKCLISTYMYFGTKRSKVIYLTRRMKPLPDHVVQAEQLP